MLFNQILEAISSRISNSSQFLYSCFGSNEPRNYEFVDILEKPVGSFTTDKSGKVYEVVIEMPGKDGCYRWLDPNFKDALEQETQMRGFDPKIAWDDVPFTDLETEEDILEKVKAICNNEEFDDRVIVPLDLSDDVFLAVAKEAHKRDITFNEMIAVILQTTIKAQEIADIISQNDAIKAAGISKKDVIEKLMAGGLEKSIMRLIESGELEQVELTQAEELQSLKEQLGLDDTGCCGDCDSCDCEDDYFEVQGDYDGCNDCFAACGESEPEPAAPVKKFSSF
jgi:hypothetical protein